ncbi:MAG: serine/threonine-protein kinase, partial [archaeon]
MCNSIETILSLEMIENIGDEGKNSEVYIMYDPQLDTKLVVKQIPKCDFNDKNSYFNEAKILYFTSHPNIMEIQHASQDEDFIYLSMPYYKKGSINSLINNKFLTVKEIIRYSLDFLTGLHYIHTKGLVHFDVKPSNILINNNNRAVLTDFGLAKYINDYGSASQKLFYKSHCAPERLQSEKISNKSDIYQAGITLYRICNGNNIFKKQFNAYSEQTLFKAIAKGHFPDRNLFLPHIPNRLRRIIKKSLKPQVDNRYETVINMINELSKVENNLNWVYNKINDNKMIWKIENNAGTHWDIIELLKNGDKWDIRGEKKKKSDGNIRNSNIRTKTGNNSIEEA